MINSKIYPVLTDERLLTDFLTVFEGNHIDRRDGTAKVFKHYAARLLKHPALMRSLAAYAFKFVWRAKKDLFLGFGRAHKLSFFVQNFMDANDLDEKRVEACSFMVMTHKGPVSMCEHNANRDDYILSPVTVHRRGGIPIQYFPLANKDRVA